MNDDERCCGTGTCMINAQGVCWCGQQWNGVEMCRPASLVNDLPGASAGSESKLVEKSLKPDHE